MFILVLGKNESFQLINSNHNDFADIFFKYYTHTGSVWMWLALGLYCYFFRKKYLVAVIAGAILSTLFAQFLKQVVYPDDLRPIHYLAENFPVHLVDGIETKRKHSFPSGHSTIAFTLALIIAHMANKKFWSVILPLLALLTGYSRVYLGQHFPSDVLAGMCTGILSAVLSLMIYRSFSGKLNKKGSAKTEPL